MAALFLATPQASAGTFTDANWVSMGGEPGANGDVNATVLDGSGNLYIGGAFSIAGETWATNVAKWNGTHWSPLGSGLNGQVNALALWGNDLYAGGRFTFNVQESTTLQVLPNGTETPGLRLAG